METVYHQYNKSAVNLRRPHCGYDRIGMEGRGGGTMLRSLVDYERNERND